jgi:hypothetical protein
MWTVSLRQLSLPCKPSTLSNLTLQTNLAWTVSLLNNVQSMIHSLPLNKPSCANTRIGFETVVEGCHQPVQLAYQGTWDQQTQVHSRSKDCTSNTECIPSSLSNPRPGTWTCITAPNLMLPISFVAKETTSTCCSLSTLCEVMTQPIKVGHWHF